MVLTMVELSRESASNVGMRCLSPRGPSRDHFRICQMFSPRNVVQKAIVPGLGNIIILLMQLGYCSDNSTKFQTTSGGPSDGRVEARW